MPSVRLLLPLALLLAAATAACYEDNPYYCDDRAYNNCGNEPGTYPCDSKEDCAGQEGKTSCTEPNPATGFGVCVQCTPSDATACGAGKPVCGTDNTCRACSKHTECASAACLPDGSCGDDDSVAYVAAAGSGTACTKTAPCSTLAAAIGKGKPFIKVAGGNPVKDTQVTVIDGKTVTILADEGAKLDRDGDGPIVEVRSAGANVKIFDLEITGATGSSGANGIDVNPNGGVPKVELTRVKLSGNQGTGLAAQGGSVIILQSTISGNQGTGVLMQGGAVVLTQVTATGNTGIGINVTGGTFTLSQSTIASNAGGGVSISNGTFDITNNFIYRNGNQDTTTLGGLNLGVAVATGNRLEFNTIVDNRAAINSGGVICNVPTFAGGNNIIARNSLAGSTTAAGAQTSGACTYPSSLVQNDVTGLMFEHPEPPAPFSYKLTAGSTAIDQALTTSDISVDADGDVRPSGAQKDIGADEYKAN